MEDVGGEGPRDPGVDTEDQQSAEEAYHQAGRDHWKGSQNWRNRQGKNIIVLFLFLHMYVLCLTYNFLTFHNESSSFTH